MIGNYGIFLLAAFTLPCFVISLIYLFKSKPRTPRTEESILKKIAISTFTTIFLSCVLGSISTFAVFSPSEYATGKEVVKWDIKQAKIYKGIATEESNLHGSGSNNILYGSWVLNQDNNLKVYVSDRDGGLKIKTVPRDKTTIYPDGQNKLVIKTKRHFYQFTSKSIKQGQNNWGDLGNKLAKGEGWSLEKLQPGWYHGSDDNLIDSAPIKYEIHIPKNAIN